MKKSILMLLLATTTFSAIAQEKNLAKRDKAEQMTVEQKNQLMLKKMTLDLNLSTSQQNEVSALIAAQSAKREAKKAEMLKNKADKKTITAQQKFDLKSEILNNQIEMKEKMKKILSKDQMAKWETQKDKRQEKNHKRMKQHRNKAKKEVSE